MRRAGTPGCQPRAPGGCDDPRDSLGCVLPSRGGGEADRSTPGAVLPTELLTQPQVLPWAPKPQACKPGHLNRACNSPQASAKGEGASWGPTDALRGGGGTGCPTAPGPLRSCNGAGEPRAWGAAAQSSAVQLWQERAASSEPPGTSLSSSSVGRKRRA